MGTIERHEGSICHGVLVKLSKKEFEELYSSEGGPGGSYKLSEMEVEAYDGRIIKAYAFENKIPLKFAGYPSTRYMNLLIEGAIENKLDEKYIEELKSIPTNPTSLFKKILIFPIFGPFMILMILLMLISTCLRKSVGFKFAPSFLFQMVVSLFWFLHDYLLKFIFGDGGKWNRK